MQTQITVEQEDWVIRLPKRFISQNALFNLLQAIENSLEEEESISLSSGEWENFIATLENPPPPTEALKKALQAYQNSGMK